MFRLQKNKGLYLELCLLLDYIEEYDDLTMLGFLKTTWEDEGYIGKNNLRLVVKLINKYLPPELECSSAGCYLVNNNVAAYTPIENLMTSNVEVVTAEIINY